MYIYYKCIDTRNSVIWRKVQKDFKKSSTYVSHLTGKPKLLSTVIIFTALNYFHIFEWIQESCRSQSVGSCWPCSSVQSLMPGRDSPLRQQSPPMGSPAPLSPGHHSDTGESSGLHGVKKKKSLLHDRWGIKSTARWLERTIQFHLFMKCYHNYDTWILVLRPRIIFIILTWDGRSLTVTIELNCSSKWHHQYRHSSLFLPTINGQRYLEKTANRVPLERSEFYLFPVDSSYYVDMPCNCCSLL